MLYVVWPNVSIIFNNQQCHLQTLCTEYGMKEMTIKLRQDIGCSWDIMEENFLAGNK